MTPAHGARALLHGPELTPLQWQIVIELLIEKQRDLLQLQQDKAAVLAASVGAADLVSGYLSSVADLREQIERTTGITC